MTEYRALAEFLGSISDSEPVRLSFDDIENLVGMPLPEDAQSISWWRPGNEHDTWSERGWIAQPRPSLGTVTFRRVSAGRISRQAPPKAQRRSTHLLDVPRRDIDWAAYDAWNEALAGYFFDGSHAQRPVYLDIEDEVVERLTNVVLASLSGVASLRDAVLETLLLGEKGYSTFAHHVNRKREWHASGRTEAPPFLGVLAFLSSIAEQMSEGGGFAADNYYGRLCDNCGIERTDTDGRNRLIAHFRGHTHELWDSLNDWLVMNEGRLGLPTARVFDWRAHVGLPISQALVKQADRDRLPALFDRWGLEPGQEMAPRDMERVLDVWLPTSNLSPLLRSLWKTTDGKQRVAEVVCVELANWDGEIRGEGTGNRNSSPIVLQARIRSFPNRRISLGLAVRAREGLPLGTYRLTERAQPASAALGGTNAAVKEGSDAWIPIESENEVSIPDALGVRLELQHDTGVTLLRNPRAVVVLTEKENATQLIESARVELAKRETLLVHSSFTAQVTELLEDHARPGFRVWGPTDMAGLPNGWSLFEDVELVTVPDTETEDLGPLVPVAWTAIGIQGGLQLPGIGTWHRDRPPYLTISAVDLESSSVSVAPLGMDDEPISMSTVAPGGTVEIDAVALKDGDYTIELKKSQGARSTLMTRRLKLRSGDSPVSEVASQLAIGRRFESPLWVVSASEIGSPQPLDMPKSVVPMESSEDEQPSTAVPSALAKESAANRGRDDEWGPLPKSDPRGSSGGCVGKAHYWLVESAGQVKRPAHDMAASCKNCGLHKWFPSKPKKLKARALMGSYVPHDQEHTPAKPEPVRVGARELDHDLLLDALTFARGGSWQRFNKIAQQMSDDSWFPRETAQNLSALGHIDLMLDDRTLIPRRWMVTPPTICHIPGLGGVVVGFRPASLVETICEVVIDLGGGVVTDDQVDGPKRILIVGLDADLDDVVSVIAEESRIDIGYCDNPSKAISANLPPLREVARQLKRFEAPIDVPVERYDATTNSWVKLDAATSPGAYKYSTRPIEYGSSIPGANALVRADNRWSKWIGSAASGQQMLAYTVDSHLLTVRIGAQLPGMYERAAVLASGNLPRRYEDGTVKYERISQDLAARLYQKLSNWTT